MPWRPLAHVAGVKVGENALDGERGAHRPLGVVLLRLGIAEEDHQPVAEPRQHVTAERGRHLRSLAEIGLDEVAPILGIERRSDPCRADEIAEKQRDRTALRERLRGRRARRVGVGERRRRQQRRSVELRAVDGLLGFERRGRLRFAQRGSKLVAARHGDDEARRLRVRLDLAPQPPDHHVDAAVERLEPPARGRVEQHIAAEDAPRVTRKEAQQGEFAACQLDCLAGFARKRAGVEIQDETSEMNGGLCFTQRHGAVDVDRLWVPHGARTIWSCVIVTPRTEKVTRELQFDIGRLRHRSTFAAACVRSMREGGMRNPICSALLQPLLFATGLPLVLLAGGHYDRRWCKQ